MALYYDAVSVLSSQKHQGSLKSCVYGMNTLKSNPAQVYALISETAKRDGFLKELLDNAQVLQNEPKLTPLLALLLCHDHFFSKAGIATPVKHPLRQSIERHKARLQSEFTRARLRRRCASVDALKAFLDRERAARSRPHPRWARINTLVTEGLESVLGNIHGCKKEPDLNTVLKDEGTGLYCHDENVPNLLAFSPGTDLTKTQSYKNGHLILQDKASCFPAFLLLGDESMENVGDVVDGCAAPGNKSTHLAAIMDEISSQGTIFACERDTARSKILRSMVDKAGAGRINVLARQDFLALDPDDIRFKNVTHLLLDPSCSGSGILGREDVPRLALPNNPRAPTKSSTNIRPSSKSKKRKRGEVEDVDVAIDKKDNLDPNEEEVFVPVTEERLQKLSNLQTRIVEHAMKFPAARRITYSTCSVHERENEAVVSRLLASQVAKMRGWTLLSRSRQVGGMKRWKHRGLRSKPNDQPGETKLTEEELDACIRCNPDDENGTMGFFVCAFVRDATTNAVLQNNDVPVEEESVVNGDEESWEGFD